MAVVMEILDDVHVLVPTRAVDQAAAIAENIWQANGMELHTGKQCAYTEGPRPETSRTLFAQDFRCMGLTHQVLRVAEEEGAVAEGAAGTPIEPPAASAVDPLVEGLVRLDRNMQLLAATGELS